MTIHDIAVAMLTRAEMWDCMYRKQLYGKTSHLEPIVNEDGHYKGFVLVRPDHYANVTVVVEPDGRVHVFTDDGRCGYPENERELKLALQVILGA